MKSYKSFQKWSQTKEFERWISELRTATTTLPTYRERRALEKFIEWAMEITKESRKEQRIC